LALSAVRAAATAEPELSKRAARIITGCKDDAALFGVVQTIVPKNAKATDHCVYKLNRARAAYNTAAAALAAADAKVAAAKLVEVKIGGDKCTAEQAEKLAIFMQAVFKNSDLGRGADTRALMQYKPTQVASASAAAAAGAAASVAPAAGTVTEVRLAALLKAADENAALLCTLTDAVHSLASTADQLYETVAASDLARYMARSRARDAARAR